MYLNKTWWTRNERIKFSDKKLFNLHKYNFIEEKHIEIKKNQIYKAKMYIKIIRKQTVSTLSHLQGFLMLMMNLCQKRLVFNILNIFVNFVYMIK